MLRPAMAPRHAVPGPPGRKYAAGDPVTCEPQVSAGLVGTGTGGNRAMAGAAAPFAFEGVTARPRPGRQLPRERLSFDEVTTPSHKMASAATTAPMARRSSGPVSGCGGL